VIAGARGDYRFADLAPGAYRIQAVVDRLQDRHSH
jgi:hypothetical protein